MAVTEYSIEVRDKAGNLRQYITPFCSKVRWEWNRIGGCGRCAITINKAYRALGFGAYDDIQIRVKSGSTTKLVYRGFIANTIPSLKIDQTIVLDVRGYFDMLKRFVVHDSGDTKTYTSKTVGFIADDIADNFIVPNSIITIAGPITAGSFTADTLDFLTSVDNVLKTLADLQGDIEYGVDENLVFFWETKSNTINRRFFVGDNISVLERRLNYDSLVNKIYLVGGDVSGTKYKKTGEDTDSQTLYLLNEEILNNSSIVTDTVANQYIDAILSERKAPQFSMKAKIKNTAVRLEDTVPLGRVTFFDAAHDSDIIVGEAGDGGSDVTIGITIDGGKIVGGAFAGQVDRISYTLSDTSGRFNIDVQLGDTVFETAAKIKRLELVAESLTQF